MSGNFGNDETAFDRSLRVERLQADVEAGVYDVPGNAVATQMIDHLLNTPNHELLACERQFVAEFWTAQNREAVQNVQRAEAWRQKMTRWNDAVQDVPERETFQQRKARERRFVLALTVFGLALLALLYAYCGRQGG